MSATSYKLNCPFCGSCVTSTVCMPYDGGNAMVALRCDTCRAQGPHEFDEVKARHAWDRRAPAQQPKPANEGDQAP